MNHQFLYQVVECQLVSDFISRIVLKASSDAPLIYQAGQYVNVVHRDNSVSPLSIGCAPFNPLQIELHLSHALSNENAQDILKMIGEEARLTLTGPYGTCTLNRFSMEQPIIFIAAGTGFAPVKSLIEGLQKMEKTPPLHLYWSCASESELYMRQLPKEWMRQFSNFSFTPVLKNGIGRTGLLQDVILQDYPDLSHVQVYVSGPEKLVYSAFDAFRLRGLSAERFVSDMFHSK